MEWTQTPESSNIERIGYSTESQVVSVEYKKSGTYHYFDVPPDVFERLLNAPSKGKFIAEEIKGAFRYARA